MNISQRQLEKMIGKMINVIKPNGVSKMEFELNPADNEGYAYYMSVIYVVPDESEFLRSSNMRDSDKQRTLWNREIRNSIKNYFDTDVIITNSGISAESYYNRLKKV